jgi:hypothetical protein
MTVSPWSGNYPYCASLAAPHWDPRELGLKRQHHAYVITLGPKSWRLAKASQGAPSLG